LSEQTLILTTNTPIIDSNTDLPAGQHPRRRRDPLCRRQHPH
jgi:hypothetical protein